MAFHTQNAEVVIMASETEFASDSDEGYTTPISDEHLRYLKEKLVKCLSDTDDFSAEIHHAPGKPARLSLRFGSKSGQVSRRLTSGSKQSNTLLVKNLPDTADEEFLEMFFEHTKRQGGGPVKNVALHKDGACRFAVIEFEKPDSVSTVLRKQPIKMQGTTVEVETYTPYLERDEVLKTVDLSDVPEELSKEIAEMKLKELKSSVSLSTRFPHRFQIEQATRVHPGVRCNGCGIKPINGPRFNCNGCLAGCNYCSACKASQPHNPSHTFTKLEAGEYPQGYTHIGFRCDGCRVKPIRGPRYRCRNCPSFDFCVGCISNKDHDPSHTFIKL